MGSRLHLVTISFTTIVAATISLQVHGDCDSVRVGLEKAKVDYEKSLSEYRELANEYFDKKEEAARKQGNKKQVDQVKKDRLVFEDTGKLPSAAPVTLRGRPASAMTTLTIAFKQAVAEYTRNKQDDLADATEKELAALKVRLDPRFTGRWLVLNAKGGTIFVITLDPSGESRTTNAPITGKWEVVDSDIRITWDGDWRDIIRADDKGEYRKIAFKPGTTWTDPPHENLKIAKERPVE